jgi:hypothetical protein
MSSTETGELSPTVPAASVLRRSTLFDRAALRTLVRWPAGGERERLPAARELIVARRHDFGWERHDHRVEPLAYSATGVGVLSRATRRQVQFEGVTGRSTWYAMAFNA